MLVNFITNIAQSEISGGFSGMNAAAYEAIKEITETHYVGPVNPPVTYSEKLISKIVRLAGFGGRFHFFSKRRLARISSLVAKLRRSDADCDFYHGLTPWVSCKTDVPYLAWSDCCFSDYIEIFHSSSRFSSEDLSRISVAESKWMQNARAIFFSSSWALERTRKKYEVAGSLLRNVGIFGAIEPPLSDEYTGGCDFLFVSTNFKEKNGLMCRRAMNRVWNAFPEARLRIVGAKPRAEDVNDPRVVYEGFLDKAKPNQKAAFRKILSKAFALIHPTTADTTAMIVIEAAYFGCPSITMNKFAIPEVTGNGTGAILMRPPATEETLSCALISLLNDREKYLQLRQKAREFALANVSREQFKCRFQAAFRDAMLNGLKK